jgi:hypothetical protein
MLLVVSACYVVTFYGTPKSVSFNDSARQLLGIHKLGYSPSSGNTTQ